MGRRDYHIIVSKKTIIILSIIFFVICIILFLTGLYAGLNKRSLGETKRASGGLILYERKMKDDDLQDFIDSILNEQSLRQDEKKTVSLEKDKTKKNIPKKKPESMEKSSGMEKSHQKNKYQYITQVGAFRSMDKVEEMKKRLISKGWAPSVIKLYDGENTLWYRVIIFRGEKKEEAEKIGHEFKTKENTPYLVKKLKAYEKGE